MAKNRRRTRKKRTKRKRKRHQVKRIDILPNEVLLDIFDFYTNSYPRHGVKKEIEAWQSLVHVCRRWRTLVFESPRRLNLRLCCTPKTPPDTLDIWPALPLLIHGRMGSYNSDSDTDDPKAENVIAVLGQSNRIYEVNLWDLGEGFKLEEVLAAMQVPFPELTTLQLQHLSYNRAPVIPDLFLGGFAPRLRYISLSYIPFPGLPNLLLSTTQLDHLDLDLPNYGYISPESMVTLLSTLSGLRTLSLGFQGNEYGPGRESQSLPSPKRSILPALRKLYFKGPTEYLEELVTHIDTPQLNYMHITFLIDMRSDAPQLTEFINYTPTLMALDEGRTFYYNDLMIHIPDVILRYRTSRFRFDKLLISTSGQNPVWQFMFDKVHDPCLCPPSTVEDLYIDHEYSKIDGNAIWKFLWLEVLLPFTAVKNLYLSKVFALRITDTLQELVGAKTTEVLPSLQNIFVEGLEPGSFQENIAEFVTARQLSDHPVAISVWYKDRDSIIKSM